jgi:ParB family chromosome partitioning protein
MKKQSGLGRGLSALLDDPNLDFTQQKGGVVSVPLHRIEPNPLQPRREFDPEALQALADSITEHGMIQPLTVRELPGGYYQIIAGERRWRAAKLAGLKEVPVIVRDYDAHQIAEVSLIENIQRKDLNPIEEAEAYRKLMEDYELTQEALSERISKNRSAIANTLRLLKLPEDLKLLVAEGQLSEGHAKVLLGVEDEALQREAAEKIIKEGLSVRQTESLLRAKKSGEKSGRRQGKRFPNEAEYENVEKALEKKLGTRIRVKRSGENSGHIEIEYYSLEELERILAHIR